MFSETECMAFNPFENTKGDSNERIISDCIVTSRKGGKCCICWQEIQPGTRIRTQKAVVDGEFCSCRICTTCCAAMASSWTDEGRAIEERYSLGMAASQALPTDSPDGN